MNKKTIIISPYSQRLRNGAVNPKNWPFWEDLVRILNSQANLIQIGVHGENKLIENCYFNLSRENLLDLCRTMDLFISVDNFFPHFCHYYNFRGIVLFSRSDPNIFGYRENINLLKDRSYLRPDQFGNWEACTPNPDSYVSLDNVIRAVESF